MELLKKRILKEGRAEKGDILKVDGFINHQVDPKLMKEMAKDIVEHFQNSMITKVATIESSGISPAIFVADLLNVSMVIMKKQPSKLIYSDLFQTIVQSYTKGVSYELTVSKKYISEEDNILIVDDFLANGETARGAIRLVEMSGASVAGVAVLIEKAFQAGREKL